MHLHIHRSGDAQPDHFDIRIASEGQAKWFGTGRTRGELVVLVDTATIKVSHKQANVIFRLIFQSRESTVTFHGFEH